MLRDLHFAFRTLRRRAAGTFLAILMLGLGIGANAVVFSLVRAFLLRPLDFAQPDHLVRVYATQEVAGSDRLRVNKGVFLDWQRSSRSFASLVAAENTGMAVTDAEQALNPLMRQVTAGYFETLGVTPAWGRGFGAEDYVEGARVVILDFGFWQSYYGGIPEVLGRTIELAGEAYKIVGVMPARYHNPAFNNHPVLWLPMPTNATPNRGRGNMVVIGRLADGVSAATAHDELVRISADLAARYPKTDAGRSALVIPLHDSLVEGLRPALLALFGAVGFVLLIACANVANLLLAQATGRRREIGLRVALGARRGQLLRQLLLESLLLGVGAAVLGLLMATWALGPLVGLAPSNTTVPLLDQVQLDVHVVLFTVGLALLTSLAFGLLPITQVTKDSQTALATGSPRSGSGPRRHRLRAGLVVAEIGFSMILLVGAGLMARTFINLRALDLGFEPQGLLTVRTTARGPEFGARERWTAFYQRLRDDLGAMPGMEHVGACEVLPMFATFRPAQPVHTPTSLDTDEGAQPRAVPLRATPGFFRAAGLPILTGRAFTDNDHAESEPVAVVSQRLAQRLWGELDPVGRRLFLGEGQERPLRIVGVAGDLRGLVRAPEPPPNLYLPYAQDPIPSMSFFLRTGTAPLTFLPAAEQTIWKLSRDVPVYLTADMAQVVRDIEWQPRFIMQLLLGFAGFALILAATGIYAVLSFAVAERQREIGIRLAVGAAHTDIVRMVLRSTMRLTLVGLALGLAGALALSRLLGSQLYDVAPTDPLTYAILMLILVAVALFSSYLPARRATRVNPVEALRSE